MAGVLEAFGTEVDPQDSIGKATRKVRRQGYHISNHLRSIVRDSHFVDRAVRILGALLAQGQFCATETGGTGLGIANNLMEVCTSKAQTAIMAAGIFLSRD